MADPADLMAPPSTTPPGPRTAMRCPVRPSSPSPARQRLGDELISRLSPTSAVEALRSPSGALKTCLDNASVFEQSFAMKTAVASKNIYDWLDELSDWPWPENNASAGFEMPPAKRRKLSDPFETRGRQIFSQSDVDSTHSETSYLGSLSAKDVAQYEKRIDQIQRDMDELDLEEIKTQVLHNHILPLSRPGTPFSDAGRSVASSASFTKMEDLTAVITAITVQALPNLSKLNRLMNTWSVRLAVLRKVPALLTMITDAEIALKSGWNAIKDGGAPTQDSSPGFEEEKLSVLPRKDFEIMEMVLQQKVSKPGRDADFMLDALEGMTDTLPEEWLERLEALERDYVNWVATGKMRVREGEWSEMYQASLSRRAPAEPVTPQPRIRIQPSSPIREKYDSPGSEMSSSPSTPFDHSPMASDISRPRTLSSRVPSADGQDDHAQVEDDLRVMVDAPSEEIERSTSQVGKSTGHHRDVGSGAVIKNSSLDYDGNGDGRPLATIPPRLEPTVEGDDVDSPGSSSSFIREVSVDESRVLEHDAYAEGSPILAEVDRNILHIPPLETLQPIAGPPWKPSPDFESEYSFLESVDEEAEEPELPRPQFDARRGSDVSMASTVLYEHSSEFDRSDYRFPSRGRSVEPELPCLPDPDEPFSDALSPPNSPPLRQKPRSTSVNLNDTPEVAPTPKINVTPPRSPLQPSALFDAESSFDCGSQFGSPGRMSVASDVGDNDVLHHQIGEVLKSIPNKIKLSSRPRAINLNPPDLVLPTRPKQKGPEPFRRSESALSTMSNLSSRAGTPSYLLAPVKHHRPQSRVSQDARHYFLSRSTGEPPMKILIRCVGEHGERVMVRVGGGWADLAEYLKEYATHHGRRSKGEGKIEVKDLPQISPTKFGSSPPRRPASAMDAPMTPLAVRKTRTSLGEQSLSKARPRTPLAMSTQRSETPLSDNSNNSPEPERSHWADDSSVLGLSGPKPKKAINLSEESKAWVEDVKTKVRSVSGERMKVEHRKSEAKLGELGKVGGTKRLFRKSHG